MIHLAERFAEAVRTLTSDGPVKVRLGSAFSEHLEHLEESDLPASMRAEFARLRAALTRVPPAGNVPRVRASVQKMSPAEASEYAFVIVKLYLELLAANGERAEPLKIVSGTKQQPPRFLAKRP
jgi:hypothetical protein